MIPSAAGGRRYLYLSHATVPLDAASLDRLVDACRRHNPERGVTGILLYLDGRFCQVIEGPEAGMADVIGRIGRDPRHRDLVVLMDEPIGEDGHALFDGWSMASQEGPSAAAARDFGAVVEARLRRSGDPAAAEVLRLLGRFWDEFRR